MAEVAPAPAAAASAKVPRKKPASKNKRSTLTVGELIVKAVSESKERNGMSLAALKKYLANGGYDVEKNKSRVKIAIKGLVNKGILIQTSGTGASGSFKLNKKQTEAKKSVKKAAPKVKKSAATRRSVVPKKSGKVKTKKTDTKKSPKKQKKVTNKKVVKTAKKSMASKKNTKSPKKGRSVKPKPVKSKAGKARKAPKKK